MTIFCMEQREMLVIYNHGGDSELAKEFVGSGPEVIKLFSCSTQLRIKFKLLIDTEKAQID